MAKVSEADEKEEEESGGGPAGEVSAEWWEPGSDGVPAFEASGGEGDAKDDAARPPDGIDPVVIGGIAGEHDQGLGGLDGCGYGEGGEGTSVASQRDDEQCEPCGGVEGGDQRGDVGHWFSRAAVATGPVMCSRM